MVRDDEARSGEGAVISETKGTSNEAGAPAHPSSSGSENDGVRPFERVYRCVARIPKGRVATYGQIADLAEVATARVVGFALAALAPDSPVPWQRVVNAKGEIRLGSSPGAQSEQRARLEEEGAVFLPAGRVDLAACRWEPETP